MAEDQKMTPRLIAAGLFAMSMSACRDPLEAFCANAHECDPAYEVEVCMNAYQPLVDHYRDLGCGPELEAALLCIAEAPSCDYGEASRDCIDEVEDFDACVAENCPVEDGC
jgi:hypothetical protein